MGCADRPGPARGVVRQRGLARPREGGAAEFRWDDGDVRRGAVETVREEELLVLRWEDDGVVELSLTDAVGGTAVHVRETSPEWSTALEFTALASWTHA